MPTLQCTNPACRRAVPIADDAPVGTVYGCPGCKQALPPVPAPLPSPPSPPLLRLPPLAIWGACAPAAAIIILWHLLAFSRADGPIHEAAVSATSAFWMVAVYVAARCVEKIGQPMK